MGLLQLEKGCCCCSLETFGYIIGYLNFVISIMSIVIVIIILSFGAGKFVDQILEKSADDNSIGIPLILIVATIALIITIGTLILAMFLINGISKKNPVHILYYEIFCGLAALPTLFKLYQGNFESVIALVIQIYVLLCIDSLRHKISDVKGNYAIATTPDYA